MSLFTQPTGNDVPHVLFADVEIKKVVSLAFEFFMDFTVNLFLMKKIGWVALHPHGSRREGRCPKTVELGLIAKYMNYR